MMGQKPRDFSAYLDVIWFDDDDRAHYGVVAGWGLDSVVVNEDDELVFVSPDLLYYF